MPFNSQPRALPRAWHEPAVNKSKVNNNDDTTDIDRELPHWHSSKCFTVFCQLILTINLRGRDCDLPHFIHEVTNAEK